MEQVRKEAENLAAETSQGEARGRKAEKEAGSGGCAFLSQVSAWATSL
jgi:hypothetical protein